MFSFLTFLGEDVGFITSTGKNQYDIDRHRRNYITPYFGSKEYTHTLGKFHDDGNHGLPAGTKLKLHKEVKVNGVPHLEATAENTGLKHLIPVNKVKKPFAHKNRGFEFENNFINHLKKHGLMDQNAQGAGATSGNDFYLKDKIKNVKHKGEVHPESSIWKNDKFTGETKLNKTAAFGQATVHFDEKKGGWHIPETTRAKRPEYCKHLEKSGILEELNKHQHPKNAIPGKKAKDLSVDHPNLDPANSYLKDHHVDVLHVGSHGTYKVGKEDKTGHGLPEFKGTGRWISKEKHKDDNKRTIQFSVRHAEKSHVDLGKDEHASAMAETLGHKKEGSIGNDKHLGVPFD